MDFRGGHEGDDLPVRVRSPPNVPGVSGDGRVGSDLRTDGLDASGRASEEIF